MGENNTTPAKCAKCNQPSDTCVKEYNVPDGVSRLLLCRVCATEQDLKYATFYHRIKLLWDPATRKLTNGTNFINITAYAVKTHGPKAERNDLWFNWRGGVWHGIHYVGSPYAFCKKTKRSW